MSIHNSRQNGFIKQLNSNTNGWQAWIGLKKDDRQEWQDENRTLSLNWTDRTNSKYQNWAVNEPSSINQDGVSTQLSYKKSLRGLFYHLNFLDITG